MNHKLSDSQLEEMIKSAVNSSGPLPPDEKFSQLVSALRELQERRKAAMDSEPYGFTDGDRRGMIYKPEHSDRLSEPVPVYRHAQPAPAVPAVSDDIGEIRVGRLPTMNQDDYPGLGDWWVQLRIGEDSDEVLARVYGATPQEANNRAEALACRAAMLSGGKS
ncbi:hypothetical protein ACXIK0_001157 [Klebsiella pneumoniae]|uniref:hypothetical protein n=1 Tax=Klebsiella pneumoniae TaxID=573 RepID=UPI0010E0C040|nr:hypothetical protein [Klebsiella pneumoniae]WJU14384.1 hypothetical protein QU749_08975 [Klebsiella pneumoniae]VGI41261.1 Uncharacterised protein [Klebsiella pneumoniae]